MFRCEKCGKVMPIWTKRCAGCLGEGTLVKQTLQIGHTRQPLLNPPNYSRLPSGFSNVDKFLNGGFLPTYCYFVFATYGGAKTTFLLQVCAFLVGHGFENVLYFSNDEAESGIMKKCAQYELSKLPQFFYDCSVGEVMSLMREKQPSLVVIDSLQTLTGYTSTDKEKAETLNLLKKIAQRNKTVLVVIGEALKQTNRQKAVDDFRGIGSLGNIADVIIRLKGELNEVVTLDTPRKNRDTNNKLERCVFRPSQKGLIEISEQETGYLLRHNNGVEIGIAAFSTEISGDITIDEITVMYKPQKIPIGICIEGVPTVFSRVLQLLIRNYIPEVSGIFILRGNRTENLSRSSELACAVAVLSEANGHPVPLDTVFLAKLDNTGRLLPLECMELRVIRAKAMGYTNVVGPKVYGTQKAIWQEAETLFDVWYMITSKRV